MNAQSLYLRPWIRLGIQTESDHLSKVTFHTESISPPFDDEDDLMKEIHHQLDAYFQKKLHQFDLPLRPIGTAFEQKVWAALQSIPYGQTRTYGEVALSIKQSGAARAVGRANNRNPIAIIIPCHRVIGACGQLVGYAGGIETKQFLLSLEQSENLK